MCTKSRREFPNSRRVHAPAKRVAQRPDPPVPHARRLETHARSSRARTYASVLAHRPRRVFHGTLRGLPRRAKHLLFSSRHPGDAAPRAGRAEPTMAFSAATSAARLAPTSTSVIARGAHASSSGELPVATRKRPRTRLPPAGLNGKATSTRVSRALSSRASASALAAPRASRRGAARAARGGLRLTRRKGAERGALTRSSTRTSSGSRACAGRWRRSGRTRARCARTFRTATGPPL